MIPKWKYGSIFACFVVMFVVLDKWSAPFDNAANSVPRETVPNTSMDDVYIAQLRSKLNTSKAVVKYLQLSEHNELMQLAGKFRVNGTGYLSREGIFRFLYCRLLPVEYSVHTDTVQLDSRCKRKSFRPGGPLVGLASFPGSGNTWTRMLLEELTGVYTGSIYQDTSLVNAGFQGECVMSRNVLVVKSHGTYNPGLVERVSINYEGVIYVVRNLFDALVSEYSRRGTKSHISSLPATAFVENKAWDNWIRQGCDRWTNSVTNWLYVFRGPVLVVRYEDLKQDLSKELRRMAEFLKHGYDEADIQCVLNKQLETFRRKKGRDFDPFTAKQKDLVRRSMQKVKRLLLKYGVEYDWG